jgi:ubiquinone biosynthesis protein COQ4
LRRRPEGRRLLAERPDLLAALDIERLRALPRGTFGRTYADFVRSRGISAQELVDASQRPAADPMSRRGLDPDGDYVGERLRDSHDLWHVLTGYSTDEAGEALVLAFTYAQTRNPGVLVLVLTGAVLGGRANLRFPLDLWRAFRRGRRAVLLPAFPFEEYLTKGVEAARQAAGIVPLDASHPRGLAFPEARLLLEAA